MWSDGFGSQANQEKVRLPSQVVILLALSQAVFGHHAGVCLIIPGYRYTGGLPVSHLTLQKAYSYVTCSLDPHRGFT